jgi:hypothetical protein
MEKEIVFRADRIRIMIDTKIPDSKGPLALTKKMLSKNENENDDFPLFTGHYKLMKDVLIRKKREELINYFFNEDIFEKSFDNKEMDNYDTHLDYNLFTMIELLFPTVYPVINDNTSSYEKYYKGSNNVSISLKGSLPNFMRGLIPSLNVDFSYLKINNKIYTITSTCILNDFINHPEYRSLIDKYLEYDKLRNYSKSKVEIKLDSLKNEILSYISKNYPDKNKIMKEIGKLRISNVIDLEKETYATILFDSFQALNVDFDKDNLKEVVAKIKKSERFSLNTKFSSLSSLIEKYLTLYYVNEIYLKGISMNISSSQIKKNEFFFEKEYPELTKFKKTIKEFSSPNREMIGKNQQIIEDYNDEKNNDFEKYLNFVYNRYIKNKKGVKNPFTNDDLFLIGVNKYEIINDTKPKFEAYLGLSLIAGELNYENLSKITCQYKDENLGNIYKYKNKNKYLFEKEYIDLNKLLEGNIKTGGKKFKNRKTRRIKGRTNRSCKK